jgi:hypothetical protein
MISNFYKTIFLLLFAASFDVYAQRASYEDIYGDAPRGDGGILGTIGLIIFGAFIVWGFISNRGFRLGVLAYAGFLGAIMFVYSAFGKEAGIGACIVAIIVLWFLDPANRDKK